MPEARAAVVRALLVKIKGVVDAVCTVTARIMRPMLARFMRHNRGGGGGGGEAAAAEEEARNNRQGEGAEGSTPSRATRMTAAASTPPRRSLFGRAGTMRSPRHMHDRQPEHGEDDDADNNNGSNGNIGEAEEEVDMNDLERLARAVADAAVAAATAEEENAVDPHSLREAGVEVAAAAAPPAPDDEDDGPAYETWHSEESVTPTWIRFHNLCKDQAVRLFWYDYDGNLRPYKEIAPGASCRQQTYLSHPWTFRLRPTQSLTSQQTEQQLRGGRGPPGEQQPVTTHRLVVPVMTDNTNNPLPVPIDVFGGQVGDGEWDPPEAWVREVHAQLRTATGLMPPLPEGAAERMHGFRAAGGIGVPLVPPRVRQLRNALLLWASANARRARTAREQETLQDAGSSDGESEEDGDGQDVPPRQAFVPAPVSTPATHPPPPNPQSILIDRTTRRRVVEPEFDEKDVYIGFADALPWRRETHRRFPDEFRRTCQTLLMAHHRLSAASRSSGAVTRSRKKRMREEEDGEEEPKGLANNQMRLGDLPLDMIHVVIQLSAPFVPDVIDDLLGPVPVDDGE